MRLLTSIGAIAWAVLSAAVVAADDAERLRQLERELAEQRARSAAVAAARRALEDKLAAVERTGGVERGGADGGPDDERVRKIVRDAPADRKTGDELRKSLGAGLEAGFKRPVDYQGSGFFIKSGDEFQLTIGARVQLRYLYTTFSPRDRRDGIPIPPSKAGANPNLLNFDDRSDFAVGRFRYNFSGRLYTGNLTYRLEIDASTRANDGVTIFAAWLNWNILAGVTDVPDAWRDALQVRFGEEHAPWGRIRTRGILFTPGDSYFQTLEASPPSSFFIPRVNPHLDVLGLIGGVREGLPDRPGARGTLEYHLAVSNGWQTAGRRYGYENDAGVGIPTVAREIDNLPAITTRLLWDVLKGRYTGTDGRDYYTYGINYSDLEHHQTPALNVGGSFAWFRTRGNDRPVNNPALGAFYRPPTPTRFDRAFSDSYSFGADFGFKLQGLSVLGELYYRKINALANPNGPLNNTQDQDVFGYYLQCGYFVIPRTLNFYYEFSGIQAGRTPSGPGFPAATNPLAGTNAPFNHNHIFGLNWHPFQSPIVKITLEGAILVNNPIGDPLVHYVSASRERQFQLRSQVQLAF